MKPVESTVQMEMIISSLLDYRNFNSSLKLLQVVQNAAAKLLTKSSQRCTTDFNWLKFQFKVVILFKAMHGQAPVYIKELLQP